MKVLCFCVTLLCISLSAQVPIATSKQDRQVKHGTADDVCVFSGNGDSARAAIGRDDAALAALQRAITALGVQAQGTSKYALISGTAVEDGASDSSVPFLWEDDLSGSTREFRRELGAGVTKQSLTSNHGSPVRSDREDIGSKPVNGHVAMATQPLHVPLFVLAPLADKKNAALQLAASDDGSVHLRTANCASRGQSFVTTLDWFLDSSSYLPLRVTYRVPSGTDASHYRLGTLEFSDYRAVSGIVTPFSIRARGIDGKARTFRVESVAFGEHGNATDFGRVGGAR